MKYITYLIFTLILVTPFVLSGTFGGLAIYVGLILGSVIFLVSKYKSEGIPRTFSNTTLSVFLLLQLIVLPFSMLVVRSIPVLVWWLVFTVIYITTQCLVKEEKTLSYISKVLVILTAGFGVYSIYHFIELGLTSYTRLDGIIGTHNVYGGFLIIPLFLSLHLIYQEQGRWQKVLWYIASGVILSSIVMTFSRGTWVSIVLAVAVSVIIFWRRAKRGLTSWIKYVGVLAVITFLMICGIWYMAKQSTVNQGPAKVDSVAIFSGQSGEENAFVARLHYYKDAWNTFTHEPITGFGSGLYANALRMYKIDPSNASFADPHNWFLKMLVDNGFVVTITFVVFIATLLWQISRLIIKRKDFSWLAVAIFTGLVGSAIHGLMDFDWSVNLLLLVWFVFAGALYGFLLNTQALEVNVQNATGIQDEANKLVKYFPKWFSYILLVLIIIVSIVSVQMLRADLARAKGDVYLLQMNNTDEAINSYFESVLINKYDPLTYYDLWRAYYNIKKYGVAKGLIEKAVVLMPQNGIYYGALARTELALGDFTNYREHLLKAIELFPASDLSYHVMLVDYDFKQKKYDEALAIINGVLPIYEKYQKALWYKNDPNSEMMSQNLLKLKELNGRIEKETMRVR